MLKGLYEDLHAATGRRPTLAWLLRTYLFDPGFKAVTHYRLAHWLHEKGIKYVPSLIAARCVRQTGADIRPSAQIGARFVIRHAVGVVVGAGARLGARCVLLQNTTLGEKYAPDGSHSYPTLGDDVTVCAGAVILGSVTIGSHSVVGANAVVIHDVPANVAVAGMPARVVRSNKEPSGDGRGVKAACTG